MKHHVPPKGLTINSCTRLRSGFTLIELLVVIAIIAVLVALLLPAVEKVRESASRMQCRNQMKQMMLGVHNMHNDYGYFPNGGKGTGTNMDVARTMNGTEPIEPALQTWGWAYQILPYVDQSSLYLSTDDNFIKSTPVKMYFCPSRRRPTVYDIGGGVMRAQCDYAGNRGTDNLGRDGVICAMGAAFPAGQQTRWRLSFRNVSDGATYTMMFGEKFVWHQAYNQPAGPEADEWTGGWVSGWRVAGGSLGHVRSGAYEPLYDRLYTGISMSSDMQRFGSNHNISFNSAYVDGSVREIRYSVDLVVFQAVCVRDDGLAYSLDEL